MTLRHLARHGLLALMLLAAAPAAAQPAAEPTPASPPIADSFNGGAGIVTEDVELPPSNEMPPAVSSDTLPRDLSPWGMFVGADWVVKAVMIGLAFASVVTWTIWLLKSAEIAQARLNAGRAMRRIGGSRNLVEAATALERQSGPSSALVSAAIQEIHLSTDLVEHGSTEGVKERIEARLARIEAAAGRRLSRGTGILASIGATAPFVGLFGTVWGIMNAFIGISEAETTNLAVVAPGIAEALLATAFGLVAAIPAVVIYNFFARAIGGYRAALGDAAAEVLRLASRDLDRRVLVPSYREAAQ